MPPEIASLLFKGKGAVLPKNTHRFRCCKQDLLCSFCGYTSDAWHIVPVSAWKCASAVSLTLFRVPSSSQYYSCCFATLKDPAVSLRECC